MKPPPMMPPTVRKTPIEVGIFPGTIVALGRQEPGARAIREPLNRGLSVTDKRLGAWQNRTTRMQLGLFEVSLS